MNAFAGSMGGPIREDLLERMTAALSGPEGGAVRTLVRPELGLTLAWAAGPDAGVEVCPPGPETRGVGVCFAGEIYADRPERDPRNPGCAAAAAAIARAYAEEGNPALERLNGIFAGVLIDARSGRTVLFNDRYGLGRVYVRETEGGLHFATRAAVLLASSPEARAFDPDGLAEFFSCGCPLGNRTLFRGVTLLPGAAAWEADAQGSVQRGRFFDRTVWTEAPPLPVETYYARMNETFVRVLPRYFRGSHPVGVSLTGGLDSRMIMACVPRTPGALPCHTFGGPYRECADVKLARRVADACDQPHEVIPVTDAFFDRFLPLAEECVMQSDGAMDVTGAVELYMNRQVRERTPVRMTGNYGSEILRGNVAFRPRPVRGAYLDAEVQRGAGRAARTYEAEREGPVTAFIAFKQVPWFHFARRAVEASQLSVRTPYLDNELVEIAFRAPRDAAANRALAHRFIAEHAPALAAIPTDRGPMSRNGDGRFSEFRREFMPRAEYVYDYGMPNWLVKADRLLRPLRIERLFLGRQKFYHFRLWYRTRLAPAVREVLLDPAALSRDYLDGREVERMVKAHTGGRENWTLELHKLLTLELASRRLLERSAGG